MRGVLGFALAAGLWLGLPAGANAQVWVSGANPYGIYGSGYYPTSYYGSSVPRYSVSTGWGPGYSYYSSGYAGYAPRGYAATTYYPTAAAYSYSYPAYGYGYAPAYGYPVRRGLFGWRLGRPYGAFW